MAMERTSASNIVLVAEGVDALSVEDLINRILDAKRPGEVAAFPPLPDLNRLQNVARYTRARDVAGVIASGVRGRALHLRDADGMAVELRPESPGYLGALLRIDQELKDFLWRRLSVALAVSGLGVTPTRGEPDEGKPGDQITTAGRNERPELLTTSEMAEALDRIDGKDSTAWAKLLSDARGNAKWALPARVESGARKGITARWSPVKLARLLVARGVDRKALDRAFRNHDGLAAWRPEWERDQSIFREYGID